MKVVIFAIDAGVFDTELYYDKAFDDCEDKIILDFDAESNLLTIALVTAEAEYIANVLEGKYKVKSTIMPEERFESFTYHGL